MFRGVNEINIDEKGRFAIPTRFRELIKINADNQLVVTIDTEEQCLLLYPLPDWEDIEHLIEALPSFNQAARRVQRLLIGHATEVTLDASGRILLPQYLRDYAGIKKHIKLVGQGKKFEIWSEENWDDQRNNWLNSKTSESEIPVELKNLSL